MASCADPGSVVQERLGSVRLSVPGMMCMRNCGTKVTAALKSVPGVAGMAGCGLVGANHSCAVAFLHELGVGSACACVVTPPPPPEVDVDVPGKVVGVTMSLACSTGALLSAVQAAGYDACVVPGIGGPEDGADLLHLYPVAVESGDSPPCTTTLLDISGMSCMRNCGTKAERALAAVLGVSGV